MTRIVSVRRLDVGTLSTRDRDELGSRLVDIVLESFVGATPEQVLRHVIFRDPRARLHLFYGGAGEVVGFSSFVLQPYRVLGRTHAVLDMGTYLQPGVRGGGTSAWYSLFVEVLRFRLRHPLMPLCCVSAATTPAGYRRAARQVGRLHPRPGVPVPPHVEALVREVCRTRGYAAVAGDPWVVTFPGATVRLRAPERLDLSEQLAGDPDARYFCERNPGYRDGHWLMVHFPLGILLYLPGRASRS